jgi:hypothetical protein
MATGPDPGTRARRLLPRLALTPVLSLNTVITIPPAAEYAAILRTVGPDVKRLFQDSALIAPEGLPKELSCGMVVGYLRGRGYSWQEAFTAMDDLIKRLSATVSAVPCPARRTFKTELITCSVGCADYLRTTLARNMRHFDHTIVVTDVDDLVSRELAQKLGADVLVSDRFYAAGNAFDRGAVYNRALTLLKHRDWVTYMDVDIVLPPDHRARLETMGLRDNVFYGMDRLNLTSDDTRAAFLARGDTSGAVADSTTEWGFGYYQQFSLANPHIRAIPAGQPVYPSSPDVFQSDYLFRRQFGSGHTMTPEGVWMWDPTHQQKLPWCCYHLGSNGIGQPPSTLRYLQSTTP